MPTMHNDETKQRQLESKDTYKHHCPLQKYWRQASNSMRLASNDSNTFRVSDKKLARASWASLGVGDDLGDRLIFLK